MSKINFANFLLCLPLKEENMEEAIAGAGPRKPRTPRYIRPPFTLPVIKMMMMTILTLKIMALMMMIRMIDNI